MKDGGWIPIDKRLINLLPKDREYTFLEAYISFRHDLEDGTEISINGYARIWSWSRNKVRNFIEGLRTGKGHIVDNQRTGKGQEIRIILNTLQGTKDRQGTGKGQARDRQGTITIDPNPNNRFIPPSLEEIKAYCLERKNGVDPEKWQSHYQSNGWKVGKNPMKDWRAAVRTWEKTAKEKANAPQTECTTPHWF